MKRIIVALCSLLVAGGLLQARNVNVLDFGAVPDGKTLCTKQLQAAIDECANTGGGVVTVPAGRYLTGCLLLRSHVELYLERASVILGSLRIPEDYATHKAIIYAHGIHDAGISGPGYIDGQSNDPSFLSRFKINDGKRPHAVDFHDCQDISVRDVHMINAGSWTLSLVRCDGVTIDGVRIYSLSIGNNDGIDIEARNVTVSNCRISSDDDAICMKNSLPDFTTEYITITNCVVASNCNPIKFGTPSYKGYRNVTVSNCVIRRAEESNQWDWGVDESPSGFSYGEYKEVAPGAITGLAGIAVEAVDGAFIENLSFSNIVMEGVVTPVFVCTGHRHNNSGAIKNLQFTNITAKCEGIIPCLISGLPDARIEGLVIRDFIVEHAGGQAAMTEPLKQNVTGYPENRMYGPDNPAGGLYLRCVDNALVENFQVTQRKSDARPTVVLDDVDGFRIRGLQIKGSTAKDAIQSNSSKNIVVEK